MSSKYKKVEKGIRKRMSRDGWKYCPYGMVKGTKIPEREFSTLRQAREYREKFVSKQVVASPDFQMERNKNVVNKDITFEEVWIQYRAREIDTCTVSSTKRNRLDKMNFLEGLFHYKLREIDPDEITNYLEFEKDKCLAKAAEIKKRVEAREPARRKENLPVESFSRRCNFNDDIKFLNSIFNWYRETFRDVSFNNPILKRHKTTKRKKGDGFIRYPAAKKKVMSKSETIAFWQGFEEQESVFYDLAVTQYYLINRIQEPCGMQLQDISLKFRKAWIRNVAIWGKDKKFLELKPTPKNNHEEEVHLNDTLLQIFERRVRRAERGCNFLFQFEGKPLSYRSIQYQFEKALKNAGLYPRFSATHFNRYSGGTAVRRIAGLDHAQAAGRWQDSEMAQHYCSVDHELQKEGTVMHEEKMNEMMSRS
ncbi:MAG: tyrosine-type recombinase/integrase [Bdellovibrionales bacterium]|nr:tyrosine-type recombinase/integrase [Bdellovibrionales bacterium]MBT3525609.1 tyrosine-type recombinase/integrase [Bdellovibrionales bacterium]